MNFTDSLKSDPGTYSAMPEGPRKDLDRKIREHIRKNGEVGGVEGIFGDFRGAAAYVEEIIRPEEGGIYTKLFGCSTLYKGEIVGPTVDSVALTKGVFIETLKMLFRFPFFLVLPIFLLRAARRKAKEWATRIIFKDLHKRTLQPREFKRGIREILRVAEKHVKTAWTGDSEVYLFRSLMMFFEADNAYWFPIQDALALLDKGRLMSKGVISEVWRFFETIIHRHTYLASKRKYIMFKWLAIVCLLSPKTRKAVKQMMLDLNLEEIKPDESDIYFTLNRRDYEYRGESFAVRKMEWDRINEKNGNLILGI